jgi:hypothetical protein
MRTGPVILLSLGLAALAHNRLRRSKREWYRNLKGWQKLLGLLAILMTVIIILNPEFLALGLLGDSTLLDMLALAISVQLLSSFRLVWHKLSTGCVRGLRWFGVPSPAFRSLVASTTAACLGATSALQKIAHHLFKDDL